jgi:hypothetical protein
MRYSQCQPDFLGIGAQKAGTSWLAGMLRRHPRIWVAPVKEVHYFDRSCEYPSPSHLAIARPLPRLLGRSPASQASRRVLLRRLLSMARRPGWQHLCWECRYLFGTYSDDWYMSLFGGNPGKVCGEMTPAYSILEPADVARVKELLPKVKIIYILRNPADRMWSHIRCNCADHKELNALSAERIRDLANSPAYALRSDYVRTLGIWRQYFPEEQFFVGFYDEIQDNTIAFLTRLLEFLGVEVPGDEWFRKAGKRVHVSPSRAMPPEIRQLLAERYAPEVEALAKMTGGHAVKWLAEMQSWQSTSL